MGLEGPSPDLLYLVCPGKSREQAAATPLHLQQDRCNNSNLSFMQAGTWFPKAASRQREIRENQYDCRRIKRRSKVAVY